MVTFAGAGAVAGTELILLGVFDAVVADAAFCVFGACFTGAFFGDAGAVVVGVWCFIGATGGACASFGAFAIGAWLLATGALCACTADVGARVAFLTEDGAVAVLEALDTFVAGGVALEVARAAAVGVAITEAATTDTSATCTLSVSGAGRSAATWACCFGGWGICGCWCVSGRGVCGCWCVSGSTICGATCHTGAILADFAVVTVNVIFASEQLASPSITEVTSLTVRLDGTFGLRCGFGAGLQERQGGAEHTEQSQQSGDNMAMREHDGASKTLPMSNWRLIGSRCVCRMIDWNMDPIDRQSDCRSAQTIEKPRSGERSDRGEWLIWAVSR